MYQDYLFIISHIGPNVDNVLQIFDRNPNISFSEVSMPYRAADDLRFLQQTTQRRKQCRICADLILHNHVIESKSLYDVCKFIYFLDDPYSSLDYILKDFKNMKSALAYYSFRLQRMALMSKEAKGVLLLHSDLLNEDRMNTVSDWLKLKEPLKCTKNIVKRTSVYDTDEMLRKYDKYLSKLKDRLDYAF